MTMYIHTWADLGESERRTLLSRPNAATDASVRTDTSTIIADVRDNGDAALRRLTKKYDDARVHDLRVDDA